MMKDSSGLSTRPHAGVEKRKILFFSLSYFWMNQDGFAKSKDAISLLKSHDELPEEEYFLKSCCKTFRIDLKNSKEEIFAAFDYKGARYPINKAIKSGVIVQRAESSAEKSRFYSYYQAFSQEPRRRNKMLALQPEELDRLEIFFAVSAEDEYLGGIGLLPSPDRRYLLYKYAATAHRYSENDLLLWHAIQYAKDAGYAYFDMSSFLPTEDKSSDQYRLSQFKKKFGGEMVDFYSYAKFTGIFKVPALLFRIILKHFFKNDLNEFALFLKKVKVFK